MAEQKQALKKGDEVYIKSLSLHGRVLDVRGAGEPEEDQYCRVEIIHYFRPSDLELVDREVKREKRDAEIREKSDHVERLREQIEAGDRSPQTGLELLVAWNDYSLALGHKPILVKK